MKTYESELQRIYDLRKSGLLDALHDVSYGYARCQDDVHDAVEALISQKYGKHVLEDEDWMEEYFDEVAEIIVPMMDDLTRKTAEEYFRTDFGREAVVNEDESIKVLNECIATQIKKGEDYQNSNSTVKRSDYFPDLQSLYVMMNVKMLRIKSLMESGHTANNESLEDSLKDLINYASFAVAQSRGKLDD